MMELDLDLPSSPDPITVSPVSLKGIKPLISRNISMRRPLRQRINNSQISDAHGNDAIRRSPVKTIAFAAPTEPGSSPLKIRVTVQAESGVENDADNYNTRRKNSRRTVTTVVPLKGEDESSPVKRRGRPRKSDGASQSRKRSLTPGRRKSASNYKKPASTAAEVNENTFPAINPKGGRRKPRKSREMYNSEQDDTNSLDTYETQSTDALAQGTNVPANKEIFTPFTFNDITPLHEKYANSPLPVPSPPITPEPTMKSVKGRQCTPVKPSGWSEEQSSFESTEPSIHMVEADAIELEGGKAARTQLSPEVVVDLPRNINGTISQEARAQNQLDAQHFISPRSYNVLDNETSAQELETMVENRENESVLDCEDFSIVSVDSLRSRQGAQSSPRDGNSSFVQDTPGIQSMIANFRLEKSREDVFQAEAQTSREVLNVPLTEGGDSSPVNYEQTPTKNADTPIASQHTSVAQDNQDHSLISSSETSGIGSASQSRISVDNAMGGSPTRQSQGFLSKLGRLFTQKNEETPFKNIETEEKKEKCSIQTNVFETISASDDDTDLSAPQIQSDNLNLNTFTPKEPIKNMDSSIQLPTPEERVQSGPISLLHIQQSSEIQYPDLHNTASVSQLISPPSTDDVNADTVASDSKTEDTLLQSQGRTSSSLRVHDRKEFKGSLLSSARIGSNEEDVTNLPDDLNGCPIPQEHTSESSPNHTLAKRTWLIETQNEEIVEGDSSVIYISEGENTSSSIVENAANTSGVTHEETMHKTRPQEDVLQEGLPIKASRTYSTISSDVATTDEYSTSYESEESDIINDSILQENLLKSTPKVHRPRPLHLSRRNMSYVLGFGKTPNHSSVEASQKRSGQRHMKSSPPILRPSKALEVRQGHSLQSLRESDPFVDGHSALNVEESEHSDMRQIRQELEAKYGQNNEGSLYDRMEASTISQPNIDSAYEQNTQPSHYTSFAPHSQCTENSNVNNYEAEVDVSGTGTSFLSRLWSTLTLKSTPIEEPNLSRYRLLPKIEPWTKTHYIVMDEMYQELKRNPCDFSTSNPTNPSLPNAFNSEIGTSMANWGYNATFTTEHMVLAARFYRLLTFDKDACDDIEMGQCCPGPAGQIIDEYTVCIRLFSVIVGEEIRRDEQLGIPIIRKNNLTIMRN